MQYYKIIFQGKLYIATAPFYSAMYRSPIAKTKIHEL